MVLRYILTAFYGSLMDIFKKKERTPKTHCFEKLLFESRNQFLYTKMGQSKSF